LFFKEKENDWQRVNSRTNITMAITGRLSLAPIDQETAVAIKWALVVKEDKVEAEDLVTIISSSFNLTQGSG